MIDTTYLLRSTMKGTAYYLSHVSDNGNNVEFDRRINFALTFTQKGRAALVKEHGHIRGRWVLEARELKRIAAVSATEKGGQHAEG